MERVARYSARLSSNGQVVEKCLGNDLQTLIVKILTDLETESASASAEIRDTWRHERVVHRFRKTAVE
jgi:hypothetical protein